MNISWEIINEIPIGPNQPQTLDLSRYFRRPCPEPDMMDDFDDLLSSSSGGKIYGDQDSVITSESTKASCTIKPKYIPCKISPHQRKKVSSLRLL